MANHQNEDKTASSNQPYPQLSDIIFNNTTNNSFNKILGELKRSTLSIPNRLHSIKQDANFVSQVASAYKFHQTKRNKVLISRVRMDIWHSGVLV
jgi:tRNA A64-2'-O-ribosylphosphate transferase